MKNQIGKYNAMYKHGLSNSSEFNTWDTMKARCYNPNATGYERYGAKGIKICDRWLESFKNFYEDMGPKPDTNYSLDRLDNSKGYSKENCRWVTSKIQARNRKTNNRITYKGKTKTLVEWSEFLGMKSPTLSKRLNKYKWSIEKAFTTPVKGKRVENE